MLRLVLRIALFASAAALIAAAAAFVHVHRRAPGARRSRRCARPGWIRPPAGGRRWLVEDRPRGGGGALRERGGAARRRAARATLPAGVPARRGGSALRMELRAWPGHPLRRAR